MSDNNPIVPRPDGQSQDGSPAFQDPQGFGAVPPAPEQYPPASFPPADAGFAAPGGYPGQPAQPMGYPQPGSDLGQPGYPGQPVGEYPAQSAGFPPLSTGEYPPAPPAGYPPQPAGDFPPAAAGYPAQPPVGDYSAAGYPSQPTADFPPVPAGYPAQPPVGDYSAAGYPSQPTAEYPPAVGFSPQPGGYAGQPPAAGYPGQPMGGYPGQPPVAGYPPAAPPKRKSKLPLLLGIVGVIVVALVVVLAMNLGGNPITVPPVGDPDNTTAPAPSSSTPEEAVQGFLDALAAGDATKALSYASDQPTDLTFLTDDVLKAMVAAHPITGISVKIEDSGSTYAYGTATYSLGGHRVSWSVDVDKFDDAWMLTDVTGTTDLTELGDSVNVSIYGVSVTNPSSVVLFPGQYDLVADNGMVSFAEPLVVEQPRAAGNVYELKPALSADATKKIIQLAEAKLKDCLAQKALVPKGCGFGISDTSGYTVNTSTIKWSLASRSKKMSSIKPELRYNSLTLAEDSTSFSLDFAAKTTNGRSLTGYSSFYGVTADISDPDNIVITFGR